MTTSRRGFLGLLAGAAAAPLLPKEVAAEVGTWGQQIETVAATSYIPTAPVYEPGMYTLSMYMKKMGGAWERINRTFHHEGGVIKGLEDINSALKEHFPDILAEVEEQGLERAWGAQLETSPNVQMPMVMDGRGEWKPTETVIRTQLQTSGDLPYVSPAFQEPDDLDLDEDEQEWMEHTSALDAADET